MCLLSGKRAELHNINGKPVLRLMDRPYSDVLAGLCSPDTICECHLAGTACTIDRKSAINRRKKMCAGDPYCEFVVEWTRNSAAGLNLQWDGWWSKLLKEAVQI